MLFQKRLDMNYKQFSFLFLNVFILNVHPNNHATLTSTPLTDTPSNQTFNFIKKHIGFSVHIDNKPRQNSFKKILDESKEWTTNQFTDHCSHYSNQGLTAYYFYDNPNFCAYLKTLPKYKDHINRLHKEFHHCRKCKKRILKETGFSEKKFKNIICQFHEQLQHEEKLTQQRKRQNKRKLKSKRNQKHKIPEDQLNQLQKLYAQYKQKQVPQIVVDKSLNNRIIEDRKNALADTLTENMPWKEKLYTLKPQAKELLNSQNLDKFNYEVCYGNEIQQQLHGEFVTIVNKASEIRNATDADIMRLVASMSEVGLECTHKGHIQQATTLANACWTFLDYGKAIAMGAFEGVVLDQVDMIIHPVQTIKNVGSLLSNVGYYFGKAIYDMGT